VDSVDRRPYLRPVLAITVFAGSFGWLASGIHVVENADSPPFHIDESHKLAEAYFWHLAFENRDFSNPAWQEDFYARTNPPVAKYIFGAALALTGHHVRDQQLQLDFERHWRQPRILRAKVPDGMLCVARWTSTLFGAGTCTLVFVIAARVAGMVAGLLAVLLVLLNPHFEYYSRLGLTDSVLMFFMTLIAPLTMRMAGIVRRFYAGGETPAGSLVAATNDAESGPSRRGFRTKNNRIALLSFLSAATTVALAAGTKLCGAMAFFAFVLGVLPAFFSGVHRVGSAVLRRVAAWLAVASLTAIVAGFVFLIINPYYWQTPARRLAETLRTYRDWTIKQQLDPGGGLFDFGQRISAVGHFSLRSDLLPAAQYLGKLGTWLTVLGFLIGLTWLTDRTIRGFTLEVNTLAGIPSKGPRAGSGSKSSPDDASAMLWWILVYVVVTMIGLPLSWRRYLLVPYVPICAAVAVGFVRLPKVFRHLAVFFQGRTMPARLPVVAGGIPVVLAAWLGMVMTDRIIDPAKLEPEVISDIPPFAQREYYESALRRDPDDPRTLEIYGRALLMWREYDEAIRCLSAAAKSLEAELQIGNAETIVRYASVSYDLARARLGRGRPAAAAEALRNHIGAIRNLRDMMVSADPKVREEYDRLISERERWTAGETTMHPAGH